MSAAPSHEELSSELVERIELFFERVSFASLGLNNRAINRDDFCDLVADETAFHYFLASDEFARQWISFATVGRYPATAMVSPVLLVLKRRNAGLN